MLSLATITALLRRVPAIAWVVLFVLVLLSLGAFGIYHHGETVGATRVHVAAVKDSVVHQRARVDTAAAKSDSVIRVATKDLLVSTRGRAKTRAVLEAAHDSTPAAVIEAVSEQLARDSVTISAQAAAIDTLVAERATRIQLDTLQEHRAGAEPPSAGGISVGAMAKDVAVIVVVVETVRFVGRLIHH